MTCGRVLLAGATLCVLGVAIAGTAPIVGTAEGARIATMQTGGGVLVVVGWGLLAWAIHRLGRSG